LILGVVQSGLPYILLSNAVEHCSPLVCSLLSAVEPLFSPVWVALFIGERPGPLAIVGGVVVITSILANMICSHRAQIRGQEPEGQEAVG
ncbi:MAG TPA: DMT family transporter, partial [Lentisphaeria bacterium]|nr:DMT family transporter [Lentisphaeria bacterium]